MHLVAYDGLEFGHVGLDRLLILLVSLSLGCGKWYMLAKRYNRVRQTEPFWVPSDGKQGSPSPLEPEQLLGANQAGYASIDMAKVQLAVAGRLRIPSHVHAEA